MASGVSAAVGVPVGVLSTAAPLVGRLVKLQAITKPAAKAKIKSVFRFVILSHFPRTIKKARTNSSPGLVAFLWVLLIQFYETCNQPDWLLV